MYRDKARYGQDPMTVVRSKPATFNAPLKWNLPERSRIFVCSWSDFFHKDADDWRLEAFDIISKLPQYNFLIPTKRIERVMDWTLSIDQFYWPNNVWLGVSVENQEMADLRIPILAQIEASVKWLSVEPMLEEIDFTKHFEKLTNYPGIKIPYDWVVYGGESGSGCRPCNPDWIRRARQQHQFLVTTFVKQLGGWPDTRSKLEDLPEDLRIREFPSQLINSEPE
jgi:protein gp37